MPAFLFGAFFIVGVLALPPTIRDKSWRTFLVAAGKAAMATALPLFAFVMSALFVPEWKGACRFGWVDCFHSGKFALSPLVLWAAAALYAVEVWGAKRPHHWWIVLGVYLGATISVVCFIHGAATIREQGWLWVGLVIPLYVSVWYVARGIQMLSSSPLSLWAYVGGWLASIPFWVASVILSRSEYLRLPDSAPHCFVVTAASRGHEWLVGPFVTIVRKGRVQRANAQLVALRRLEALWRRACPRSHAAFRRLYNVCGPRAAAFIRSPWAADLAYLSLKPAEWLARLLLGNRQP